MHVGMIGGVFVRIGWMSPRQRDSARSVDVGEIGTQNPLVREDILRHRSGPVGDDETILPLLEFEFARDCHRGAQEEKREKGSFHQNE